MIALVNENDLLREARRALRMTLEEFAVAIGVPTQKYKNYEYGRTKVPESVVREAQRIYAPTQRQDIQPIAPIPMVKVPVVGAASAGPGTEAGEYEGYVWVPQHMASSPSNAWVAEGDSMMPWIQPGDIVIAREMRTPKINKAFLFRREDGTVSVKVIRWKQGSFIYQSINPAYPDDSATSELLGIVTGIYRVNGTHEMIELDSSGLMPPTFFE